MTFFGIKFLDDIDLPEFPFPELGPLLEEDTATSEARGPRRCAAPNDAEGMPGTPAERRRYH